MSIHADGWHYGDTPGEGDCRKLVTLDDGMNMTWVGIRAWNAQGHYWMNNGEPTKETVLAWRDLLPPARGFYDRGELVIPKSSSDGLMGSAHHPSV